ncbi:MAG: cation-transporting P-type ATPase, partial [Nocardioidaceae bacterium]
MEVGRVMAPASSRPRRAVEGRAARGPSPLGTGPAPTDAGHMREALTEPSGLSTAEATRRLAADGPNVLPEP